jgi:prevent-host-death family protein
MAGKKKSAGPPSAAPTVAAADFKATCLELMDRVRETGQEYVVTKHGKPVAKLVPYVAPKPRRVLGSMKGTVLKYERPFDPIDAEWDIDKT